MKYTSKIFDAIRLTVLRTAIIAVLVAFIGVAGCGGGGGGGPGDWTDDDDSGCTDRDRDGYYTEEGCGTPVDCKDRDPTIHPGAVEYCVGIDNDCDGLIDEGCVPEACGDGVDNDGDGVTDEECRQGSSFVSDTGQTRCYTQGKILYPCPSPGEVFYGQDACYSFISSDFTKLDGSGNPLPAEAASWTMVQDNVTGLIWEVKTDDDGIHGKDYTYTWADAIGVFIVQLNDVNFGGYSDWRLPTIEELSSIVNYGIYGPAINLNYFPNTMSDYYWSSTTNAADANIAWLPNFFDGSIFMGYKMGAGAVRAVRGRVSSPTFSDNGDGTVTVSDNGKSLMWTRDTAEDAMIWQNALDYCENLTLAGYSDWRLPNIKELRAIVDLGRVQPAINLNYFPDTLSQSYWSSTTCAYDAGEAWIVGFYSGGSSGGNDKTYIYGNAMVRAVRGGH